MSPNQSQENVYTHHRLRTPADAFTLLELLVVMSIIAVLAGLLFPVIQGSMITAKKAVARGAMSSVVTGLSQYHTDYGRYPNLGIENADTFVNTENHRLFSILRAKETAAPVQNPRKERYFAYKDARGAKPRDGYDTAGNLLDPWGHQYKVKYDSNYDDSVAAYGKEIEMGVVVWSVGRDGVEVVSHDELRGADDVVSFQ